MLLATPSLSRRHPNRLLLLLLLLLPQGLKRRKEVATARSLLELLQEIAHVAAKVRDPCMTQV